MSNSLKQRPKTKNLAPIILTSRDEEIIRAVGRFRFLRSNQITKIVEGSPQGILRRLGKLFQHGYLSRPPQITIQIALPGYKGGIYSLGPSGRKYLASQGVLYSHRQQEKQPKIPYLAHTLKVADFLIDLENCLPPDVDLFHHDELRALFSPKRGVSWKVPIQQEEEELEVGVIPDYVFALIKGNETCVYCLEIDRGTMPVFRENLSQTSFARKILAYHETWKSRFAEENFDWKRFRVITVTSSSERSSHLTEACQKLLKNKSGGKLFLFSSESEISESLDIYTHFWRTGKGMPDLLLP